MVTKTFTLTGNNIQEPVCHFVRQYYQQAHESNYPGGFIRLYEDFSFLNDNDIVNCFRVDFSNGSQGKIIIEMISGGAGSSLIWRGSDWSEDSRINHFRERLEEFCNEMKIELQK